jgi:hypothetical protein
VQGLGSIGLFWRQRIGTVYTIAGLTADATTTNFSFQALKAPGFETFPFASAGYHFDNVVVEDVTETATPLPAALPLFATGLGALGLIGWRRTRKLASY